MLGLQVRLVSTDCGASICVVVDGEVDLASAGQLRDALAQANAQLPRRLEVDIADVTYLDSSGLHAIIEAAAVAADSLTDIRIVNAQPIVRKVFEACGLRHLLDA